MSKFIKSYLLLYYFWLGLFQYSTQIRFRSSRLCLPLPEFEASREIDTSQFNGVTWDIKYHLRSKQSPVNPFHNVFYPENDLSCLTFRTRFTQYKGAFDISCGFVECRIATFSFNLVQPGMLLLNPYTDNKDCKSLNNLGKMRIIATEPEKFMLIYSCYFLDGWKIEGGYLLSRAGLNLSQTFYKKALRPLMVIANYKDLIVSDLENMSACNCTDYCSYYEERSFCDTGKSLPQCTYPYYLFGVIGALLLVAAILVINFFLNYQLPFKID